MLSSWSRSLVAVGSLVLALLCGPGLTRSAYAGKGDPRVVVVGGGLAGLITTYELQSQGIAAHLLDANDYWGGRVVTVDYGKGLKGEYGMHEIWDKDPLREYVKKFGLELSEAEEPYSSVLMDGKYYPYVQDTKDAYFKSLFTEQEIKEYNRWLGECEKMFDEIEHGGFTPKLAELQKISFAKWVQSFKLPPRVNEFIRMALECEVATDWDNVSSVYSILQFRIFLHGSEQCRHLKAGNARLIEALVKAIKGPKTLGARVTRIVRAAKPDGTTDCTVYYKKDNVMQTLHAEKVVVAVPYHVLHAIQMEPSLTDDQWKAVDGLVAGMYTVVHLVMDVEANKFLMVDGKIPFPVLSRGPLGVIYGFLEKPAKDQKEEIFSLLIHGDYTRSYLEPQDKIRSRVLAGLDAIWPEFSKHVHGAYFYSYHPAATPGWPPGRSPIDTLHQSLKQENVGLFLAGDYIFSSHAEGAVMSGQLAAKKIGELLKNK